jgi:hypothetical protein
MISYKPIFGFLFLLFGGKKQEKESSLLKLQKAQKG